MNKVYAGIGSRKSPPEVCQVFAALATRLAEEDWTLRSGRADGADKAFEYGARNVNGKCEIFLPRDLRPMSLRNQNSSAWAYTGEVEGSVLGCKVIARLLHPNGKNLSPQALELHARNTYQIIGQDLNSTVNVVICWTEGARGEGGTGQALRLAKMLNIPIIDYGMYTDPAKWWDLNDYIVKCYGVFQ